MDLNLYLRTQTHKNLRDVFIKSACEICNSTEKLHLHHLKLFSEIVSETLDDLTLSYKDTNDYSEIELRNIVNIVLGKHIQLKYLTLCENCHKLQHKELWKDITVNDKHNDYYKLLKLQKGLLQINYLSNVVDPYLNMLIGKVISKELKEELINTINYVINGRKHRSYNKINEYLRINDIKYKIVPKKSNNKRYWEVIRTD